MPDLNNLLQNMQSNPLINILRASKNPKQEALLLMEQNMGNNNPFIKNILDLARSGQDKQIETIARNMIQEKGGNPDELYRQVMSFMSKR